MKLPKTLSPRFILLLAAIALLNPSAALAAVSTSISHNASGVLLGQPGNPNPDPNAGITDVVTVSAAGNAGTPTGTVTATVRKYENFTCGTVVAQSGPQPLVNGSATFHFPATQIGGGGFYWSISYTSDQPTQYTDSSSNCTAFVVIQRAAPSLKLQSSKFTATVGQTDDVKATVVGGYQPSGPVTFYVSGPNDSSCGQKTQFATVPVGSDATATATFQPTQPGTYVLTATFSDTLNNAASTNCGDSGNTVTFIPAGPQPATSFKVTTPPNVYAGQSFDFTVTAYDAYSNVATGYNGTVHFTSTSAGVLPSNSTLTNGTATFHATLNTNGSQTITATDTNNSSITGTSSIYVYPQSTFVVTTTADSDDGTCNSNCTLREAINAANNQAGPATITFNIPNMAGCTAANQCTVTLSSTLPAVNDDVAIDGSVNSAKITIEANGWHALNVNSGKRAVLAALKFQNATVPPAGPTGGAVHNDGTMYLSGTTFYNCQANAVGGGALANTGTLDVTDCYFSLNSTRNGGTSGGAIYNTGSLVVRVTTFDSNQATGKSGGAVSHVGGSLTITGCTFSNNTATGGNGGAIAKNAGATITKSTFNNNSSDGAGGAILSYGDITTLANCTFYGNQSGADGAGNSGAAFALFAPRAYITNCTFQYNVGPAGTINNYYNSGDVILRNVLIDSNTGGNCGGRPPNADSSNISDDATCGSATQKTSGEIAPGSPGDNGGPTKTIALNPGSAAIGAGNDAYSGAPVGPPNYGAGGTDQRGVLRPQGSASDVGAYEVGPPAPPTVSAPSYDDPVNSGPINLYNLTNASAPPTGGGSVFFGTGVTGNNGAAYYFDPTGMPVGTVVTITYEIYDVFGLTSSVTFTIRVTAEVPSLLVTTGVDSTAPADGVTSLREALAYAHSLGGAQTVTFSPNLAGQTVTVTQGELVVTGNVTFDGSAVAELTISGSDASRIFHIAPGGTAVVKSLTLANGSSSGSAHGGAIYHNGASLTLQNSTFRDNRAIGGAYGGAISADSGSLSIAGCTFRNNGSTGGNGGAIVNFGTQLTIINSTFSGNSALNGGAIESYANTTTLTHCTIVNNSASFTGGGVERVGRTGNTVSLQNTLVAANTAPQFGPDVASYNDQNNGAFTSLGHNLIGNGDGSIGLTNGNNGDQVGTGAATINGNIGPLQNNGGPTLTVALLPGSPAFDAGVAIAGLTTDQRGTARPQGAAVDIGAFELVPSQAAAIPIVGPLGGSYENSVQVSITSTSAGTAVRYTLDGSTPSATNGVFYTAPFTLTQTATVKAIAYNGGWLPSPIASVGFAVLTPLPYWRNLQGLAADGSQDLANPSHDGVANLLKYAFNMAPNAGDLAQPNIGALQENGTAGLPFFEVDAQGRLTVEFVRRKASTNPGIAYIVETGSDLNNLTPLSLAGASVVSIDSMWERVTVTDPTASTRRFGRVRIQSLGTYFNDFNAAVGAATLRGAAVWTNGAVKLTDETDGGFGAVTFDGITTGPQLTGFTAKFNLQLGPTTTGVPADGASFAVGDLGPGAWGESGPATAHNLAVGFDTYDNGGIGAIGIHLWVNGVHIAADTTNPYTNGAFVPVEITYQSGAITVKFNGAVIFDNVAASGFSFLSTDKFGIGARTGGAKERAAVDDVQIAPR